MNDLSPEARSLLASAQGGDDPAAADEARVRRALAITLGAGAIATSAATAGAMAKAGGSAAWLIGTLAVGTVVVTSAAVLVFSPAHDVGRVAAPPEARATSELPRDEGPLKLSSPPDRGDTNQVLEPAPLPQVRREMHPVAARVGETPTTKSAPRDSAVAVRTTLEAEVKLLRAAQEALRTNDVARSLEILDEHDVQFPSGVLNAEAHAARIFALCAAGKRKAAHQQADRFARDWPNSPLTERVKQACVDSPTESLTGEPSPGPLNP